METVTHYIVKINQDETLDELIFELNDIDEKSYDGSQNLYLASNELHIFNVTQKEFENKIEKGEKQCN